MNYKILPKCPKCEKPLRIWVGSSKGAPLVVLNCVPCRFSEMAPDIDAVFRQVAKYAAGKLEPLPHLKPITTTLKPAPKDHERFQDSQG